MCANCESLAQKSFHLFRSQIWLLRVKISLKIALHNPREIVQRFSLVVRY